MLGRASAMETRRNEQLHTILVVSLAKQTVAPRQIDSLANAHFRCANSALHSLL
jgi:hypothetical protein